MEGVLINARLHRLTCTTNRKAHNHVHCREKKGLSLLGRIVSSPSAVIAGALKSPSPPPPPATNRMFDVRSSIGRLTYVDFYVS